MVIEWKSILLIALILFAALTSIKIFEKNLNSEAKRKIFHIVMGLTMLILPYIFTSYLSVGILALIGLAIMYILKHTRLKNSIGSVLYSVDRESLGEVFFIISVFLVFYLSKGNKILYSVPILVLTFADSTAALIGKNYAKKDLAQLNEDSKSIEGSFMFFMVAFMVTLVPILLYTQVGREETLIIATIIGFNVALIEMISHTGNDNLLIPLTTYAFLSTHIGLELEQLRINLIILGAIFLIVTIANRVKAWSKLALVETIVVGYLAITLYGIYAIIPPVILFLTVMNFPKVKENEKKNLYDARIIETNIIIGTAICGLAAITGLKQELFMIYASCYSMHLIINTFVRLKYYFGYSGIDSILISASKGIAFIFIPSLLLQKLVFGKFISVEMMLIMVIALILSAIFICIKKKDVKNEEISINNGYMHMSIVLLLTLAISFIQYFQIV